MEKIMSAGSSALGVAQGVVDRVEDLISKAMEMVGDLEAWVKDGIAMLGDLESVRAGVAAASDLAGMIEAIAHLINRDYSLIGEDFKNMDFIGVLAAMPLEPPGEG